MAFTYEGFKLGEKKEMKAKEEFYHAALKQIHDKLGVNWKLTVDWATIQEKTADTPENNDSAKYDRRNLGWSIYENYCKAIGDEIAAWPTDTIEAVNEAVKDKEIVLTMDPVVGSHNRHAICKVDSKITFQIAQDGLSNYYLAESLTSAVESSV